MLSAGGPVVSSVSGVGNTTLTGKPANKETDETDGGNSGRSAAASASAASAWMFFNNPLVQSSSGSLSVKCDVRVLSSYRNVFVMVDAILESGLSFGDADDDDGGNRNRHEVEINRS